MRIKDIIGFLELVNPELEAVNSIGETFEEIEVCNVWMFDEEAEESVEKRIVRFKTEEDVLIKEETK